MDPLDWVHQWDDYEMYMYAEPDSEPGLETSGIFMQVSKRTQRQGAEEWELLYSRHLEDLPRAVEGVTPGSPGWEDTVLRTYLKQHPDVVADEKGFLHQWLIAHQD